jgi:hypothetical protein
VQLARTVATDEDEITSLRGPVEKIGSTFALRIPLEAGGRDLIECSRGISEIEGDCLKITIPDWMAGMLRIDAGSTVSVDNRDGKCNIHPIDPLPLQ